MKKHKIKNYLADVSLRRRYISEQSSSPILFQSLFSSVAQFFHFLTEENRESCCFLAIDVSSIENEKATCFYFSDMSDYFADILQCKKTIFLNYYLVSEPVLMRVGYIFTKALFKTFNRQTLLCRVTRDIYTTDGPFEKATKQAD